MSEVLIFRDCVKRFDTTLALDGVSLSLNKGEWLGLLGPNGAGKTTLIRAISGRIRLDSGSITMPGVSAGDYGTSPSLRCLGIVPQTIAIYPLLTATENLKVFGAAYGLRGRDLRSAVDWALDWTGLGGRAREPVKSFSVGMKRRLNLACGILHRPPIILLDEPVVGVDPHSQQRILHMLEQLRREGASLLYTTHQLDEAERVCTRIAILDHGKLIALGTLEQLVAQTIGPDQRVTMTLDAPLADVRWLPAFEQRGSELVGRLRDLSLELPPVVTRIQREGRQIKSLRVDRASLGTVFLHLTGRELRE